MQTETFALDLHPVSAMHFTDLLRPHQHAPVERLLRALAEHGSAVDFSDTGTGKTYVSAAVAASLALPCLVVCPKIAQSSWARAADHFGEKFSVIGYEMLRTGKSPFGTWSGGPPGRLTRFFKCTVCQCKYPEPPTVPCPYHSRGIHCLETKKIPHRYGVFTFHPAVKLLIFDECHRCNGIDSLNAEMLIAAKRQKIPTLALTATAGFSPMNLRALGYLLDWHNDRFTAPDRSKPAYFHWLRRLGCMKIPGAGWKWAVSKTTQSDFMAHLRHTVIPARGVRVTSDTIPGFPKCLITADLFDIGDPEKVNALYKEMEPALLKLKKRSEQDVAADHPLTMLLRARQKLELLKVPIVEELITDDLEKGFSPVVFVNFRQTIDELLLRFPGAGVVDGQTPDREGVISRFQDNSNRILFVNSEAGGVAMSLHDLHGDFPRSGKVMPCFSATTFRQLVGRLPRDGGKSFCRYQVILAAGTVETKIHRTLTAKLSNLDALNDGDLMPDEGV